MKLTMSDSVAIVTGGGSGIGREICLHLAAEGGAVAVVDMNGDNARAVAAEVAAPPTPSGRNRRPAGLLEAVRVACDGQRHQHGRCKR